MAAILKETQVLETGPYDPHKSVLKSMAAAFHVISSGNRSRKQGNTDYKKPQCVFCKKDHPSHNCDVGWMILLQLVNTFFENQYLLHIRF